MQVQGGTISSIKRINCVKGLYNQEDEDGGQAAWDYCEAGCPVTAECPPGWVQLPSGCYQTRLEVEAGVDR